MDEIIQTLIEGLLQQKETLDLTIEELNALESATEKDNKIVQDRLDKLVVDLDTLDNLIKQLEAKKPEVVDLSPYATLDKLNEILDVIPNYEAIKLDLIAFVDTLPKAKDGTNGMDGVVDYDYIFKKNKIIIIEEIKKNIPIDKTDLLYEKKENDRKEGIKRLRMFLKET